MEVVEGGKGGRGTRRRFRKGGQGISLGEGQFCADFKEVREQLIEFYLGRAFPAEATARACKGPEAGWGLAGSEEQ